MSIGRASYVDCRHGGVERVDGKILTARSFVENYAIPGTSKPVLLLNIVEDWAAFLTWRTQDEKPNYKLLGDTFGSCQVPVIDCGPATLPADGEQADDVFTQVRACTAKDYFTWASNQQTKRGLSNVQGDSCVIGNSCAHVEEMGCPAKCHEGSLEGLDRLFYLKDWHFVEACHTCNILVPYTAPEYLASPIHDWLNLYLDKECAGKNDYRFCYIGVAGTSTLLHHDVMFSHSWSANICGQKRWIFFPPEASEGLLNSRGEAILSTIPGKRPSDWASKFPNLEEAWSCRLEVIQEPGELMFVPSGWYHEVENLTDAVSINHNWLNATNAAQVWEFLKKELAAVHDAISDVRDSFDSSLDFETHCQTLMHANSGINCAEWLSLLCCAATEISDHLSSEADCTSGEGTDLWTSWSASWSWHELRELASNWNTEIGGAAEVPEVAAAGMRLHSTVLEIERKLNLSSQSGSQ